MRILALTLVLLAVVGLVGIAVTAIAGDEAEAVPAKTIASETTPSEAMPVRPLLPMPASVDTAASAPLREASSDAPLVMAALYWLLLGGIAVRRVRHQR